MVMKLTELRPVWLSFGGSNRKTGFIFDCPCCRSIKLTCKCIYATMREQVEVMRSLGLDPRQFVPTAEKTVWKWEGDFINLNVSPSIDASSSGHWHGFIKGGLIQ